MLPVDQLTVIHFMEETLANEEIYRSIAESASDMIFIIGTEGVLRYANPSCARLLNTTPSHIDGHNLEKYFPPDTAARLRDAVQNQVQQGTAVTLEEHFVSPAIDIWLTITTSLLRDKTGTVTGILCIGRDITALKNIEENLKQNIINLKAISSATRHDINNKLTIVSGYIQLMKLDEPAGLGEYISIMEKAVTDISRLLKFSKEYEKIGSEPSRWQDVHGIAQTGISEVKHEGISFFNEITGLKVKADVLLERVFHHIFENSVKHGEKTSFIRLRYEQRAPDVYIIIEDDGKGIPGDQKERIFARSLGNNGGLGLFLCREVLSSTGISIQEKGQPGTGTRFEIRVPAGMFRFS